MDAQFQWMFSPENKKTLVLMRGCPSSGKSFRAKQLAAGEDIICSADHFFGLTAEEYVANWCVEKLEGIPLLPPTTHFPHKIRKWLYHLV